MDLDRLEQFSSTKRLYDAMPQKKEFLIPTRNADKLSEYLQEHDLIKNVRLLPYKTERGFNCSRALNIGVRNAKYPHIVVTSPEVKPLTDVLGQLENLRGRNVICEVIDEDENHKPVMSLVNKGFRNESPAYYFLAMFNKEDIEVINGWDEDFMNGYAYEDNDFGARWNRAELPYEINEEIKGLHQYHPRLETIQGGSNVNFAKYNDNNNKGIIKCANGLSVI